MRGKAKLIGIAAISLLVTAAAALAAFGPAPDAQAQSSDRSVTDVSLAHNDSHHLTIKWEEPELRPKDYRVSWAKESEGYKTWSDSSGNAFPTETFHAVSDVQPGEEYKVRVRARYEDSSGPWSSEATYTVPADPPANDDPPEDNSNAPTNEAGTMPEHLAILDWTDVEDAVRYELEVGTGGANPGWDDITGPDSTTGIRAFVNGSTAIIAVGVQHGYTVRVRGVFEDGSATGWMAATLRFD